jgi:flagellar basal-body rod modification protein FlgD
MHALHNATMPGVTALDSPPDSGSPSPPSSSPSSDGATITANDFLTLLVAEMRNQDPTASTDPNAYIDQLVQVNSLQQLIQINETLAPLSSLSGSSGSSGSDSGNTSHAMGAASRLATSLAPKRADIHSQSAGAASPQQSAGAARARVHQS